MTAVNPDLDALFSSVPPPSATAWTPPWETPVAKQASPITGAPRFVPTDDWQVMPEGALMPPGCEYQVDLQGKTLVSLLSTANANPTAANANAKPVLPVLAVADTKASPIRLTMLDTDRDNETCKVENTTWGRFVSLPHHRREDKDERLDRKPTGFSLARFCDDACQCGDAPRPATKVQNKRGEWIDVKAHKGCPDHVLNNPPLPDWAPRGHRKDERVEGIVAIFGDLDKSATRKIADENGNLRFAPLNQAEAEDALTRLRSTGLETWIYSSHSYNPAAGKYSYRWGVMLSREITPAELGRIFGPLHKWIGIPNGLSDNPAKGGLWYLPSAREGAPVHHEVVPGGVLDVDAALAMLPPEPVKSVTQSSRAPSSSSRAVPSGGGTFEAFDFEGKIAEWCPEAVIVPQSDGRLSVEVECPQADLHTDSHQQEKRMATASRAPDGELNFHCHHQSHCADLHWQDFRKHHDPQYARLNDPEAEKERLDPAWAGACAEEKAPAPPSPPTDLELRTALGTAAKRLSRSTKGDKPIEGALLTKLLKSSVCDQITELQDLARAAKAAWKYAPPGTTREQILKLFDDARVGVGLREHVAAVVDKAYERTASANETNTTEAEVGDFRVDEKTGAPGCGPEVGQHNVNVALAKLGVSLRFNELAQRAILVRDDNEHVLEDQHVNALWLEIDRTYKFRPAIEFFRSVLDDLAHQNSFHPVRDYLRSLPAWDRVPRVEEWLIKAGAPDTKYVRAVSRIVPVAGVRRAFEPGCLFQEMLVIEGKQGKNKSRALQALVQDRAWFTDSFEFSADPRKMIEATEGKWIVEAGELAGMNRQERQGMKQYLARLVDEARMAYGRLQQYRPRQFILIGTTNDGEYLEDPTGNRRYWPVLIEAFDLDWMKANRDQFWAEAYVLHLEHPEEEYIRLDPSLYEDAAAEQAQRRTQNPMELVLGPALNGRVGRVRNKDVWKLVGIDGITRKMPTRTESNDIISAMTNLGWERPRSSITFAKGDEDRGYWKGTPQEREQVLEVAGGDVRVRATEAPKPASAPVN